jgi:hypothetical protein
MHRWLSGDPAYRCASFSPHECDGVSSADVYEQKEKERA